MHSGDKLVAKKKLDLCDKNQSKKTTLKRQSVTLSFLRHESNEQLVDVGGDQRQPPPVSVSIISCPLLYLLSWLDGEFNRG